MVTTRSPKTIVKPTALGPVANTDTKFLIYGLFQKGRVLAQDGSHATGRWSLDTAGQGHPAVPSIYSSARKVGLQRAAEAAPTALGPGSLPKGRLLIAETGWLQTAPSATPSCAKTRPF